MLGRGGRKIGESIGAGRGDGHAGGFDQLKRDGMIGHAQTHVGNPAVTISGIPGDFSAARGSAGRANIFARVPRLDAANPRPACAPYRWTRRARSAGWWTGRPFNLKILATAAASSALAPSPYTVSVGNATRPPRRIRFAASVMEIAMESCAAHSGSSSLPSDAVLPVLRNTRYAWMNASRSPSSTRSTSPTESLVR